MSLLVLPLFGESSWKIDGSQSQKHKIKRVPGRGQRCRSVPIDSCSWPSRLMHHTHFGGISPTERGALSSLRTREATVERS